MIKAAGFQAGQYGDLVIATVAARAFKQQNPDSHLTFAMAEKYRDMLPLFFNHPNIDDHHIWDGYDNWPSQVDKEYIAYRGFDHVFNAMPPHSRPDWYRYLHYAEENCVRFGLRPPKDLSYELVRWFPLHTDQRKTVTLTLFPSKGTQMDKGLLVEEAEKLCIALKAKGYNPVQLGGKYEVALKNAVAPHFSIFEATKLMLSSAFHITTDTGFSSIAAGYKHRVFGIYGYNYPDLLDNWTQRPINVNANYINDHPNSVTADQIIATIEREGL